MLHREFRVAQIALLMMLLAACKAPERSERWIGHYQYPGSDLEFPIFMELTFVSGSVTGRSVDNSDVATVRGNVVNERYDLLLHPQDEGNATDQDVRFGGTRTDAVIIGEWEHASGARGTWAAELTELDERAALNLYRLPCSDAAVAHLEVRDSCAGGA